MVYARVHDKTVAEDYFKAMEQVEQQLALPMNLVKCSPSTSELLVLVDSLQGTRLGSRTTRNCIGIALWPNLVGRTADPDDRC